MKSLLKHSLCKATMLSLLLLFASSPARASEKTIRFKKFEGAIDVTAMGVTPFVLEGTATVLGQFTCLGEVEFSPGPRAGSLLGQGVAVFEDRKGHLLVGVVNMEVDPAVNDLSLSRIQFSWRDFVEFSDGTIVTNTGPFVHTRPPGLVVIAIIAILIGLLLPAVQKVREAAAR